MEGSAPTIFALVVITALWVTACSDSSNTTDASDAQSVVQRDFSTAVNPFIGTQSGAEDFGTGGGAGNTFPGATLPFGMFSFSPDTVPSIDNFAGGYTYSDSRISGFSLTHVSGAGCQIYQDIPIMPTAHAVTTSPVTPLTSTPSSRYVARFEHAHEQAQPGYYQVRLNPDSEQPIDVALTATERSGMARFDFSGTDTGNILLNPGGSAAANSLARIHIDPDANEVTGTASSGRFCYQDNSYTVYFAARFDAPVSSFGTWDLLTLKAGRRNAENRSVLPINAQPIPGGPDSLPGDPSSTAQAGGWVTFDTRKHSRVQMKVGISFVSVDNARANLYAENPGWDFQRVRSAAHKRWNQALAHIVIDSDDPALETIFYTALYHSLLSPSLFSDANGDYRGMDNSVHVSPQRPVYSSFSGWDTYRTQMPLLAMLMPDRAGDMLRSLVLGAKQTGWLPKWSYANQQTNVMVGDPAALLIGGAHALGVTNFDTAAALSALLKGANQPAPLNRYLQPGNSGYIQRPGLAEYKALGYIPFEENVPSGAFGLVNGALVWGTVSTSLEYALADFAIRRFAWRLGQGERANVLAKRSRNWRASFNPATRYLGPRLALGLFLPGIDPTSSLGFTEGSVAQYSWFVPHDMAGLINSIGGQPAARRRLDRFFLKLNAGPESKRAFLGNEPSLFTPWIYAWLREPARTGPVIKQALTTLYTDSPSGMPGNDDLGALSSWWVLASLGLMPAVPGTDTLLLNAPLFKSATVRLPNSTLAIKRSGVGDFVTSLTVDGQNHDRAWLRFASLRDGNHQLHYSMASEPQHWATSEAATPPSYPAP